MIINGRGPTNRHVSRTLRVALDWLFDSISLDTGIHIQFADTTRQIADVLTEGSFPREQWDRLIGVFNIMDQTTSSCSHLRSLLVRFDESISKRQPQQEEEARSAETSRPVRNLCAERISLSKFVFQVKCEYSVCSSPEPKKIRGSDFDNKKPVWSSTEKSVATLSKGLENSNLIHRPINEANEILRAKARRQKFGKSKSHLCQFPVNQALWRIFMISCVCATVHLCRNRDQL